MELQKRLVDSEADTLPAVDPLIGKVLENKYQLLERLGSGGMGTVYRARHLVLDRDVAIKILRPEYVTDPIIVKRFHREACAAARINDPRVVNLFGYYDNRSEGLVFIVMELIRGITLETLLEREGRITPVRAVALMLEICGGVGAAHEQNIVHRDLKPGNIMLPERYEYGDNEAVKIVDFGICKLPSLFPEQRLTEPGVMMGTSYYMSPEQCLGRSLDVRADVYSLGVIIYQMLAGAPPFTAGSIVEVLMKHLHTEAPPLIGQAGISRELNSVIMRALSKDPQARQSNAIGLAQELKESVKSSMLHSQHRWWQDLLCHMGIFL